MPLKCVLGLIVLPFIMVTVIAAPSWPGGPGLAGQEGFHNINQEQLESCWHKTIHKTRKRTFSKMYKNTSGRPYKFLMIHRNHK